MIKTINMISAFIHLHQTQFCEAISRPTGLYLDARHR